MGHTAVREYIENIPSSVKTIGDGMSVGVLVSTFASWLPAGAAFMTILWTAIRIYETKTVQSLLPCKVKSDDK